MFYHWNSSRNEGLATVCLGGPINVIKQKKKYSKSYSLYNHNNFIVFLKHNLGIENIFKICRFTNGYWRGQLKHLSWQLRASRAFSRFVAEVVQSISIVRRFLVNVESMVIAKWCLWGSHAVCVSLNKRIFIVNCRHNVLPMTLCHELWTLMNLSVIKCVSVDHHRRTKCRYRYPDTCMGHLPYFWRLISSINVLYM